MLLSCGLRSLLFMAATLTLIPFNPRLFVSSVFSPFIYRLVAESTLIVLLLLISSIELHTKLLLSLLWIIFAYLITGVGMDIKMAAHLFWTSRQIFGDMHVMWHTSITSRDIVINLTKYSTTTDQKKQK